LRAVWKSQQGVKNSENEDRAFVDQGMRYFILADGVGGEVGGAIASSIAVSTVSETLAGRIGTVQGAADLQSLIKDSIRRANEEIRRASAGDHRFSRMASTIALAAVNGTDLVIANVGDTRIYAISMGRLSVISQDHSAANELVRHRLLKSAQIRGHPFRNIITRSLGHAKEVEPFVARFSLNESSLLMLCTDGIWSVLEDSVLEDFLAQSNSMAEKCISILNAASENGSTDDLTCVLVDLTSSSDGVCESKDFHKAFQPNCS
jgi:serine/threonine protein phosphatase PrpC